MRLLLALVTCRAPRGRIIPYTQEVSSEQIIRKLFQWQADKWRPRELNRTIFWVATFLDGIDSRDMPRHPIVSVTSHRRLPLHMAQSSSQRALRSRDAVSLAKNNVRLFTLFGFANYNLT